MNTERTTNLEQLKAGQSYVWGELIKIHEIFEYTIVEYHPFIYRNNCGTNEIDRESTNFGIYVDGKNISKHTLTPDEAIVEAIAHKYDGPNTYAGIYFMKMLKQEATNANK